MYKIILLGECVVENEFVENWILNNLYQTGFQLSVMRDQQVVNEIFW